MLPFALFVRPCDAAFSNKGVNRRNYIHLIQRSSHKKRRFVFKPASSGINYEGYNGFFHDPLSLLSDIITNQNLPMSTG